MEVGGTGRTHRYPFFDFLHSLSFSFYPTSCTLLTIFPFLKTCFLIVCPLLLLSCHFAPVLPPTFFPAYPISFIVFPFVITTHLFSSFYIPPQLKDVHDKISDKDGKKNEKKTEAEIAIEKKINAENLEKLKTAEEREKAKQMRMQAREKEKERLKGKKRSIDVDVVSRFTTSSSKPKKAKANEVEIVDETEGDDDKTPGDIHVSSLILLLFFLFQNPFSPFHSSAHSLTFSYCTEILVLISLTYSFHFLTSFFTTAITIFFMSCYVMSLSPLQAIGRS
jgi:hypothetical protein